ncbi:homoserine O-acetyltransferase MetX [Caldanaerobius polysaccharolyticus]|uniref:homoserine O-acetyltransferase MetX n=1 Tax=Caldanaerobius polysaccharolyticus TaxID=44256 RepID=UPI00054F3D88|nr:homoserine O-acetyltransferase [Caldanaerobius polysaccharolyticus]
MIVKKRYLHLTKDEIAFTTESGYTFDELTIAYEVYGKPDIYKNNIVLVLHALSGDSHAAGRYSEDDKKPGWWDGLIGPGKYIDTEKYCVICSNVLGGCQGTTGPSSINPRTGKPYASDFPEINIRDMVRVQKILLDYLGISHLKAVIGGSMGGMQALEWAVTYPTMMDKTIVIAATPVLSPFNIAFNYIGITAILNDPNWNNGYYYDKKLKPDKGLSLARMIGMITYKSDELFDIRFGREQDPQGKFQCERYLEHHGQSFLKRFDANSYICILKAMNAHDISKPYGTMKKALQRIKSELLVVGIDTDIIYPPKYLKEFVSNLSRVGGCAVYCEISSNQGHDSFLVDIDLLGPAVKNFIEQTETDEKPKIVEL